MRVDFDGFLRLGLGGCVHGVSWENLKTGEFAGWKIVSRGGRYNP
jgi:hypothetical protein